jgi:hypothetical protein
VRLVISIPGTPVIDRMPRYRNNVSGSCKDEPPPGFQGGLLADDMGLGKTLSMICLIAANQACKLPSPPITPEPLDRPSYPSIKTTLLIVPPPRRYIPVTLCISCSLLDSHSSMGQAIPPVSLFFTLVKYRRQLFIALRTSDSNNLQAHSTRRNRMAYIPWTE